MIRKIPASKKGPVNVKTKRTACREFDVVSLFSTKDPANKLKIEKIKPENSECKTVIFDLKIALPIPNPSITKIVPIPATPRVTENEIDCPHIFSK